MISLLCREQFSEEYLLFALSKPILTRVGDVRSRKAYCEFTAFSFKGLSNTIHGTHALGGGGTWVL